MGGQLGVGYTYFANPSFGIHTGINFALYNSTMKVGELSNSYNTLDNQGVEFEFRSKVLDYKENQYALYATIPLMLQYHQSVGKHNFYVGAGGSLVFLHGHEQSPKVRFVILDITMSLNQNMIVRNFLVLEHSRDENQITPWI